MSNAQEAKAAFEQITPGIYALGEYEVRRVNSRRWDVFKHDEPVGNAKSLSASAQLISQLDSAPAQPKAAKPAKAAKAPRKAREDAPADLVGNKITETMINDIRHAWDELVENGIPGKMKLYRQMASKHGLGLETVAKIARRDIYPEASDAAQESQPRAL